MALVVKNTAANAGELRNAGLISGLGKSPGGGHGSPLQYSGLENPMDCNNPWGRKELDTTERFSLSLRTGKIK